MGISFLKSTNRIMVEYSFSEMRDKGVLGTLKDVTRGLSMKLWSKFQASNMMGVDTCLVQLDFVKNRCVFILIAPNQDSVDVRIDIDNGYYDMFVNDEEVVIQQKVKSDTLEFILSHLKSTVEEELIEDVEGNVVKKRLVFYWNGKTVNTVGSISVFSLLLKSKRKRTVTYEPWING